MAGFQSLPSEKLSENAALLAPKPNIRTAVLADVPDIQAIYQHHRGNTPQKFRAPPWDTPTIVELLNTCLQLRFDFLVVEAPESEKQASRAILGYCFMYPSHPADNSGTYAHQADLYVSCAPEVVGQGVGQLLMEEMITRLKVQEDFKCLFVSILLSLDETQAQKQIRSFQRVGFVDWSSRIGLSTLDGKDPDSRYMMLWLQENDKDMGKEKWKMGPLEKGIAKLKSRFFR
jgi:L-amino acid N-acyltransferase YncA